MTLSDKLKTVIKNTIENEMEILAFEDEQYDRLVKMIMFVMTSQVIDDRNIMLDTIKRVTEINKSIELVIKRIEEAKT